MARQRHTPTTPERLLGKIATLLERDDLDPRETLALVLQGGPFFVEDPASLLERMEDAPETRAELVGFLRTLARNRDQAPAAALWRVRHAAGRTPFSADVGLQGHVTFSAMPGATRLAIIGARYPRDVIVLQLLFLAEQVGVESIGFCKAGCGRMVVKTYHRHFCSPTCQHRVYMATRRENEKRKRALAVRRRRRTKGAQ